MSLRIITPARLGELLEQALEQSGLSPSDTSLILLPESLSESQSNELDSKVREINAPIFILGKRAMSLTLGETVPAREMHLPREFGGLVAKCGYDPKFFVRTGGSQSPYFGEFESCLKSLVSSSSIILPKVEMLDEAAGLDLLKELTESEAHVGFDIETNGFPQWHEKFNIVIVGISTLKRAWYIKCDSSFFTENQEIWKSYMAKVTNYVYNMSYEGLALSHALHIPVFEMNLVDVMLYPTVFRRKEGLKTVAVRDCGLPDWSINHSLVRSAIESIIKTLRPMKRGHRPQYLSLRDLGLLGYSKELELKPDEISKMESNLRANFRLLVEYLKSDELDLLSDQLITEIPVRHPKKEVYFELVPHRILGEYCGLDSFGTLYMYEFFKNKASDTEIRAFNLYQTHAKLQIILESPGICWNDKLAENLYVEYSKKRISSLQKVILNPLMRAQLSGILTSFIEVEVSSSVDLTYLKSIWNPISSHKNSTIHLKRSFSTKPTKIAFFIKSLVDSYKSEELPIEKQTSLVKLFASGEDLNKRRRVYHLMCNDSKFLGVILSMFNWEYSKSLNFEVESTSAGTIEELFSIFECVGLDIEDESTWTPEFDLLIHYRTFKKTNKVITSYIEGSVGRGQVYRINKKDFDKPVPTRYDYTGGKLSEDQVHVFQPTYNCLGAETKRWKSLAGDTKVLLKDGSSSPIKDLAKLKKSEEYDVMTFNTEKDSHGVSLGYFARKTHHNKSIELTLSNGETLRCTSDHKFLLEDNTWCRADNLGGKLLKKVKS